MTDLVDRYRQALEGLLPQGLAWVRKPGGARDQLLEAMAASLAEIDERAALLLEVEADPRTTTELLEEWLEFTGLPDPCTGDLDTALAKRAAIVGRLITVGDPTPAGLTALALTLGYVVEIEEHKPFAAGVAFAGMPLYSEQWAYAWTVKAPDASPRFATVGFATIGDPLVETGNDPLECLFESIKPAHTVVRFTYDELWAGYSPWQPYTLAPAAVDVAPTTYRPTLTLGAP